MGEQCEEFIDCVICYHGIGLIEQCNKDVHQHYMSTKVGVGWGGVQTEMMKLKR